MPGQAQLLVFSLDDRPCALVLGKVVRVIHAVDATPLPHAPETVLGLIDLQGELLPLFNIRGKFKLKNREIQPADQFIIASTSRRSVALFVDSVSGVVECPADAIVASQTIMGGLDQVDGVIQLPDGPALIYDLDRFLSSDEEQSLTQAMKTEALS